MTVTIAQLVGHVLFPSEADAAPRLTARSAEEQVLAGVAKAIEREQNQSTLLGDAPTLAAAPFVQVAPDFYQSGIVFSFNTPGVGIYFRREGSDPSLKLVVRAGGAVFRDFYPGCRLSVPFDQFSVEFDRETGVVANPGYGGYSYARLVIERVPGVRFEESSIAAPAVGIKPIPLLANYDQAIYTPMTVGAVPAPSFSVVGFSRIAVYVSKRTGAMTSFDVQLVDGNFAIAGTKVTSAAPGVAAINDVRAIYFDVTGYDTTQLGLIFTNAGAATAFDVAVNGTR